MKEIYDKGKLSEEYDKFLTEIKHSDILIKLNPSNIELLLLSKSEEIIVPDESSLFIKEITNFFKDKSVYTNDLSKIGEIFKCVNHYGVLFNLHKIELSVKSPEVKVIMRGLEKSTYEIESIKEKFRLSESITGNKLNITGKKRL